MEMLLYIFGNWCCILAGIILLHHYYFKTGGTERQNSGEFTTFGDSSPTNSKKDIMVSRDLQIMLMIGAFLRVYWSCSPPPVWSEEETFIQYMSITDVFASPILWTAVVYLIGLKQKKYTQAPMHFSWPALTFAALICGAIGARFLPPLDTPESWPFADTVIMFNMVLDGFAMIPQMHLIAHSDDKASSEASHFVGLLCLGRVLRMMFWMTLFVAQIMMGDGEHGHYIWTFIVPDVVHTVIMGDYLYLWLKKVKKDQIEPMLHGGYGSLHV
jgi:hypothetical protein